MSVRAGGALADVVLLRGSCSQDELVAVALAVRTVLARRPTEPPGRTCRSPGYRAPGAWSQGRLTRGWAAQVGAADEGC